MKKTPLANAPVLLNPAWAWPAVAVFGVVLLLYVLTLTPGVPPTDSGELALAAWLPGVAHAPGFPAYMALAWAWSHLFPAGSVAWRLNLLSAVCTAGAAALVYLLARETFMPSPMNRAEKASGDGSAPVVPAALAAAAALATGRVVWGWATVTEVYGAGLMLAAAVLWLVVRSARGDPQPEPVALTTAALLFGIGLGGHLTSMALLAPGIAFYLGRTYGWRFWYGRRAVLAALALLAGTLVYLYLPLVSSSAPLLNWGQPDTWQRFWRHVTAAQYRVSLFSAPVWPQVQFAVKLWWTQFGPVGLGMLALGSLHMARRRPALFAALLLIVLSVTVYAWAYVIEDDQDAYYLPAFVAASAWVAWGVMAAADGLRRRAGRPDAGRAVAGAALALIAVSGVALNYGLSNRASDTIPGDYVRDTFAEVGPRGLILTRDWQFYSPALYLQQVEGLRQDVTVIDTELLRRDWYFLLLQRTDPGLMAAVSSEARAFRTLRDAWERGDIPEGDARIDALQAAYEALLDAFITQAAASGRSVHAGPNRGAAAFRELTLNGQPDLETNVGRAWGWVSVGLTFQAMRPNEPLPPFRPLIWLVQPFTEVVLSAPERKIQASRADAAAARGLLRARAGDLAGAEADWRTALAVDPGHVPARQLMARLKAGSP